MTDLAKPTKKKSSYSWFLWWIIDPVELDKQVSGYSQLKIHQSARGISLLLFIGSAVLTALITELMTHDRTAYIDSIVFIALGAFIYLGHRWAMILGMSLWTLEKLLQLVQMVQHGHAPNPFGIVIFWAIFMHAMFLAFRVEQARRKRSLANPAVFD